MGQEEYSEEEAPKMDVVRTSECCGSCRSAIVGKCYLVQHAKRVQNTIRVQKVDSTRFAQLPIVDRDFRGRAVSNMLSM